MNKRFSISKLPAAMRKELADAMPVPGRFFRVVNKSNGFQFVCGYEPHLVEHIRKNGGDMPIDRHCEISDEADSAFKLLDTDNRRAFALLQEVVKHVAQGRYNTQIIERLRKICENEKLHEAEAILASVPPREFQGPIEEWCLHAIQLFAEMRFAVLHQKRVIADKHVLNGG